MAGNYTKSKLKRKKSSVEELQTETRSSGTPKTLRTTLFSSNSASKTEGPGVPAAAWWKRQPLPAVENLWAFALTCTPAHRENLHWDPVPDLPHPSTARPAALKSDDQLWCDLRSDVAAFPEPPPPSSGTSSSPDPLRLGSSQQDLSAPSRPVPDPRLPSHGGQSPKRKAPQLLGMSQRPSVRRREEGGASSAGPSGARGEQGRRGGEPEEPISGLNHRVKASEGPPPLQKQAKNKEEVQRSIGGGGGGGGLQSCPMCLQVFPVGSSQMDRDGHLAQCLSDVNVDVTW
ncbi:uncharacterized protein [Brachyistius frenatus]|uniref:uncharacterized protein n=1 Tax=Brachyistius frenatus TaxID=100188 RepID=UPI0037E7E8A9